MANNRLYIVDKENKNYILFAKSFGYGWKPKNNNVDSFLSETTDLEDECNLLFVHENDAIQMDLFIYNEEYTEII